MLWADNAGNTTFDDASLFARNCRERVTKKRLMVQVDRRDDCEGRVVDHVSRIQPSTKANLKQGIIGVRFCKSQQASHCCNLEIRDAVWPICSVATIKHLGQCIFGDQFTSKADTFVKACKVRRGIGVNLAACRLKTCTDHGLCGPFAIGASDVDHGGQLVLWVFQGRQ